MARLVTMTTGNGEYGMIENGAVAVTGDRISWLGPMDDLPADPPSKPLRRSMQKDVVSRPV